MRDIRDEPTCFTRPVLQAFIDGCAANGVPESPDYNGPVSHVGVRCSANRARALMRRGEQNRRR